MNGVAISNVSVRNVAAPLFMRLGDRARPAVEGGPKQPVGRMRNVTIYGIRARGAGPVGCPIAGLSGHPIENLSLRDIRLEFSGGGTAEDARRVPAESADRYPEFKMFGTLPAFGLYARHLRGVRLRDIELIASQHDARTAITLADVQGLISENAPVP